MSQNPRESFIRRLVSRVSLSGKTSSSSSSAQDPAQTATTTSHVSGLTRSYHVKPPVVGPIVGASDAYEARVFLAAPQGEARSAVSRGDLVLAVAKLSSESGESIAPIRTNMRPEFDYTGVIGFTDLTPNTQYLLRCGYYIVSAKDKGKEKEKGSLNFKGSASCKFTTASIDPKQERNFVFGSCRYLMKLHKKKDISFFDRRGDETFRSILKQINEENMKTDVFLMLGDQIYSDDLNVLHFDDELHEFLARYRDVFSQPALKELMMHVPTSMTLDDHEIKDNFPKSMGVQEMKTRYIAAMHAYQIYQVSHSTLFPIDKKRGSIEGTPKKYWYTFSNGCCDWFMTDTRTERRIPSEGRGGGRIMSQEQMDAIKEWLKDGAGIKVKIIASSVPVYPVVRGSKDKWGGFPKQKAELLEFIFENKIPKVMFISGDIHMSLSMELQSDGHKIHSVVSSPFFWPFPIRSGSDLITTGDFKLINGRVLSATKTSEIITESNFTRVHVTPKGFAVKVFSRKGELLDEPTYEFDDPAKESI